MAASRASWEAGEGSPKIGAVHPSIRDERGARPYSAASGRGVWSRPPTCQHPLGAHSEHVLADSIASFLQLCSFTQVVYFPTQLNIFIRI